MDDKMDEHNFEEMGALKTRRSLLKLVLYLGLVLALITGLLWSAFGGVSWLIEQAMTEAETAVATSPSVIQSTPTATASIADPANAINRIAFVNSDGQVETMAPDGSDGRVISDETNVFLFPTWSPTGAYVAAIGGGTVYRLADSTTTVVESLYASRNQNPFYLYWSPDGRFISFLANHPGGMGLFLAPTDASEEAQLLELGSPFYWDWTADSAKVLIHTGFRGQEARLALLDVDSGLAGRNAAMPGSFQAPDISRDGRYWAYAELDENGSSWLIIAETTTGTVQRQRHAGQVALSWSPTADQLAFISGGAGRLDFSGPLQLMDAETGETRLLSRETVLAFFWSPDGRYIAAITGDAVPEGIIAEGNGRNRLSKSAQQHPAITLNVSLIDTDTGEKRFLTAFEPTLTFITQFLPFFDQYALSHRLWSPASDAIVLPSRDGDTNNILVVPITGDPQRLASGDMPFWSQN